MYLRESIKNARSSRSRACGLKLVKTNSISSVVGRKKPVLLPISPTETNTFYTEKFAINYFYLLIYAYLFALFLEWPNSFCNELHVRCLANICVNAVPVVHCMLVKQADIFTCEFQNIRVSSKTRTAVL